MRPSSLVAVICPFLLCGCVDHGRLSSGPASPPSAPASTPEAGQPDIPSEWDLIGEYTLRDGDSASHVKLYCRDFNHSWPTSLAIYAVYRTNGERWATKELYHAGRVTVHKVIKAADDHVTIQLWPVLMLSGPGALKEATAKRNRADPEYQVRISLEHGEPRLDRVGCNVQETTGVLKEKEAEAVRRFQGRILGNFVCKGMTPEQVDRILGSDRCRLENGGLVGAGMFESWRYYGHGLTVSFSSYNGSEFHVDQVIFWPPVD
jgi:hypothetical protein